MNLILIKYVIKWGMYSREPSDLESWKIILLSDIPSFNTSVSSLVTIYSVKLRRPLLVTIHSALLSRSVQ